MEMITSTSNRQVRQVRALLDKARERNALDLFVAEGPKMCGEAPADRITQAYVSESFARSREGAELMETWAGRQVKVCLAADPVFDRMSDTASPQGVACLLRQYHYREEELAGRGTGRAPLIMVLENLQDPGNLGTIIRAGEGAGVTGILLSRSCVDVYNPKVIRSTMGSVYRVPFARTEDLYASIRAMKAVGIRFFAAHLHGRGDYDREDYTGPAAFMIGNESRGLTEETAALADVRVRIPMLGQVESLNAAMAAGILMYEAARQRRSGGAYGSLT